MALGDPYISEDDLAEYLRLDSAASSAGSDLLAMSTRTTTEWINSFCRREFNLADAASARYFDVLRDGTVLVDDIGSETITVATDSSQDGTYATTWAADDFQAGPLGSIDLGEPITSLIAVGEQAFPPVTRRRGLVKVTAVWGWPAVPSTVKQAALIQAARLYRRFESPEGVLGGSDFGVVRVGSRVDPDVEMLLAPYRYLTVG
jgi:hypothetical protein